MANTFTITDDGLLAYEDFAGQTDDDDATSTDFSFLVPSTVNFKVKTVGGIKCVKSPDQCILDTHGIYITTDAYTKIFAQYDFQWASTLQWWGFFFKGSSSDFKHQSLNDGRLRCSGASVRTGVFKHSGNGDIYYSKALAVDTWHTAQHLFKSEDYMFRVFDERTDIIADWRSKYDQQVMPTGSGEKRIFSETRGNFADYKANLMYMKDSIISFTGLTSGMKIIRYDSSGNFVDSVNAESTTAEMDAKNWNCRFPHTGKWEVLGTDGSQLYIDSTDTDVYGGATIAYSGDTAGSSGGGRRSMSIINGGVL